jgi:hypothetical protein
MLPDSLPENKLLWMRGWLEALCGFGWLDLGQNSEGQILFRWSVKPVLIKQDTAHSEAFGPFYIQPDFEIIVPPEVSFRVRWELGLYCESVTMDVMSIYRISRASITAAAQQGRTVEEMIDFLNGNSAGIPENVLLSLQQWAKELGRTSFAEVLLLRCKDEEAAKWIAGHPGLQKSLEPIGRLDFIVDPSSIDIVEKVLVELHLSPPRIRADSSSEPQYLRLESDPEILEQGIGNVWELAEHQAWIYNGRYYQFYERDTSIPRRDQLFPGLPDIPGVWLREMRKYHPSTGRKIIEQALQWSTKIMLRLDGSLAELIPKGLEGEENWRVHGLLFYLDKDGANLAGSMRETSLSADQWEEMRILLPEM